MPVRGIRGAIDVAEDTSGAVLEATKQLLTAILKANPGLHREAIASAIFTTTRDLNSAFPAQAARQLGWDTVPMICSQEIPVPEAMPRVIRVLLLWNTDLSQAAVSHVYLGAAENLRPDLAGKESA